MPSSLIKDDDGVGTRADLSCDLIEVKLHRFAVAEGQHQSGACSELRAHGTEQVGRLRPLIVGSPRSRSRSGPAIGELVLLSHPHLILEPHLYRRVRRKAAADFLHAGVEVFLNASIASPSCVSSRPGADVREAEVLEGSIDRIV